MNDDPEYVRKPHGGFVVVCFRSSGSVAERAPKEEMISSLKLVKQKQPQQDSGNSTPQQTGTKPENCPLSLSLR